MARAHALASLLLLAGSLNDHADGSIPARPASHASRSYGVWHPTRPGECSRLIHDRYSTLGPDGRLYPTWHPPADPSGCRFGHDHGAAPAREVPFGYPDATFTGREDHARFRVSLGDAGHLAQEQDRP